MKVEHAWVVFDTKASKWILENQDWTNNFDLAKVFRTREDARWAAWLVCGSLEPNTLQLQQIEAVWTVKSRETYEIQRAV